MPSLQELIDRYRNGDDDVDEVTAVPKHATGGRRAANSNANGEVDYAAMLAADDDVEEGGGDESAMYPIFIPSKGRYDLHRPGTCALLARSRIPFTVVVEPQEQTQYNMFLQGLDGYDPMLHAVAVLPASHQGVSFVRNHIVKHLAPPSGWFWQMDDDIRAFSQSLGNKKNTPISSRTFFKEFASRMKHYPNAAMFSAEYEMFAYSYGPGDVAINSYNNIAKCFKRELMPSVESASFDVFALMDKLQSEKQSGAKADDDAEAAATVTAATSSKGDAILPVGKNPGDVYRFKVREDYDIVLRMIENGHITVRFRDLSFRVPSMSECAGGMTDYYTKQRDDIREQNRLFISAWPSVSREVLKGAGKDLRFDVKVNWAALNPSKGGDPAALLKDRSVDVETLIITDADAAVATKLKEKDAATAAAAKAERAVSSWKSGGNTGRGGQKKGGAAEGASQRKARGRGGAANARSAGAKRSRTRRHNDSSDEDDADGDANVVGDDVYSDRTLSESDDAEFNSDDDDDEDASDLSSVASSSSGEAADDDDIFDDECADEDAYFELMESFYQPHKARKREREAERLAAIAANGGVDPNPPKEGKGKGGPRKERVRAPPPPKVEAPPTGWAGYAMVMWRDVEPEGAADVGLTHLDPSVPKDRKQIDVGCTVAFIPALFEVTPSVMVGTIISLHEDDRTVQIAPGRKYRGVPLQTVPMDRLYNADCDPFKCAEALDKVLQPPTEAVVQVTRSNLKDLLAKAAAEEDDDA